MSKRRKKNARSRKPTTDSSDSGALAYGEDGQIISSFEASFSGPLPPPETLARYEQAHPGAAERIITMAEKTADHVHQLDCESLRMQGADRAALRADALVGRLVGLAAIVVCMAATVLIVWVSDGVAGNITASILGAGTLASIVRTFVTTRPTTNPPE